MTPLEFTREYQRHIPFLVHLKIHTEALGEGTASLTMPIEPHLTNSLGTVHGGVTVSLLDVAMCTAARTLHPDSIGVVTIDLTTSFLDGATGGRLRAEGRVLRDTRTVTFVEAEAWNDAGALVAKAIGTVRVKRG